MAISTDYAEMVQCCHIQETLLEKFIAAITGMNSDGEQFAVKGLQGSTIMRSKSILLKK